MAIRKTPRKNTNPSKTTPARRRASLKGIKGGAQDYAEKVSQENKKAVDVIQEYTAKAARKFSKIGKKGGTAALLSGAAGVAIGATLGAAITRRKRTNAVNQIADHALNAIEEIKKYTH